ncbi:hypothetical protein Hanom_Chr10g00917911 [Helianthus anomalus]
MHEPIWIRYMILTKKQGVLIGGVKNMSVMLIPKETRQLTLIPHYRETVDEEINKVIYVSLEKKKKTVEEIVVESQKLMNEVKKEKVAYECLEKPGEKAVAEKQPEEEE